jgi:acyl-CoA thioester hydrolase
MEMGRVDWLNAMGFSYAEMERQNIMLPVYHIDIKYIRPMVFGGQYQLKTTLKKLPTNRVIFDYEINDDSNNKIAHAELTLVFTDGKNLRPTRPPKDFIDKCHEKWEGDSENLIGTN